MKNKHPGRPKIEQTKKHISFRLSDYVRKAIQSKRNQVEYIEQLVRNDLNK